MTAPPRLRQAVLAAVDLEGTAARLREQLELAEPFSDPGVGMFGLRNLVFALGDTFLEIVSPVSGEAPAARLLARRGPVCGYMLMFQLDDLAAARTRAAEAGVREVLEIALEDIDEVHLHPADMRGAIVSLSRPEPSASWRWGGRGWAERSAAGRVGGAAVAVRGADGVRSRWEAVLGAAPEDAGVRLLEDPEDRGLVEIVLEGVPPFTLELAGVRLRA